MIVRGLLLVLLLAGSAWAQAPWSGCQYLTPGANITILCPDALGRGGATISAAGGGAGGAPTTVPYWTGAADATLTAEKNLGALSTGLVLNTAGTPSTYPGAICANQFVRVLSASGVATCASVANTDLVNSTVGVAGTTNQIASSTSSVSLGGSTTLSLPATLIAPGSLAVTTRTGTPSTFATFDSGGKLVDGAAYVAPVTAAPVSAQYWTGAADATLTAEKNLGALGTGLVLNTAGTPTAYAGTSCAGQFPRALNASGVATCATVANTDLASSAITLNGTPVSLGGSASWMAPPCGRLTLTSGQPVPIGSTTGASTVYYTPYLCNSLTLWDGGKYVTVTFAETAIALSGLVSGRPYDVFGYLVGGVLTLQLVAWTNDTTRASAITMSEGLWLKTSDSRLLLGTIYTTSATTTEDSAGTTAGQFGGRRFVSNAYNRVPRRNGVYDTTNFWSYTSSTWRIANGATSPNNCIQWVSALSEQGFSASVRAAVQLANNTAANYAYVGVGLDGAGPSLWQAGAQNTLATYVTWPIIATSEGYAGAGRHVVCWLESGADSTSTFLGQYAATVSGMTLLVEN
jgi:hypothetical protein